VLIIKIQDKAPLAPATLFKPKQSLVKTSLYFKG